MKLRQLQHYLDLVKWRESERRGCDMCEKYARCRFCNRHAPNPCAAAYLKLKEAEERGEQFPLSAGQLPEPVLPEKFDPESVARAAAQYEKPVAKSATKPVNRRKADKKSSVVTLNVCLSEQTENAEGTRLFVLTGNHSAEN